MSRFACGHCGTEVMAERGGGAVMLKAVAEAIRKVQAGTDKTAAELSLVRLTQELAQKQRTIQAATDDGSAALIVTAGLVSGLICFFLTLLAWSFLLRNVVGAMAAVWAALFVGVMFGGFVAIKIDERVSRGKAIRMNPLRLEIEQLQLRIHEARKIANS